MAWPAASDAANQAVTPAKYPRELYPEIEAHDSGMLRVGDGHALYYDVSGNPDGVPAIFLHGGPGGGISPRSRRFFDPAFFRIVIFDQRGSGKSQPNAAEDLQGSLVENNTPKLVEDIEKLREHLKVDKWGMVLGGSWGSTLALAYAEAHPAKVRTLLLRGVFLFEPEEVDYLFAKGGTQGQHPAAWAACRRGVLSLERVEPLRHRAGIVTAVAAQVLQLHKGHVRRLRGRAPEPARGLLEAPHVRRRGDEISRGVGLRGLRALDLENFC